MSFLCSIWQWHKDFALTQENPLLSRKMQGECLIASIPENHLFETICQMPITNLQMRVSGLLLVRQLQKPISPLMDNPADYQVEIACPMV